jgi:RNA polymerase sigma factor (sigma-70 family)
MTMNDAELIERSWAAPDEFGAIFDRHFAAIYRFCARRVGVHRGEDLAGEVFRWSFEHRGRYDVARPDARPWLYGIALNLVRTEWRSSGRQQVAYRRFASRAHVDIDGVDVLAASAVDAASELAQVAVALGELSAQDVETILLYAWEGLSYGEIAESLSIPIGTVRSRISRARVHLSGVICPTVGAMSDPSLSTKRSEP